MDLRNKTYKPGYREKKLYIASEKRISSMYTMIPTHIELYSLLDLHAWYRYAEKKKKKKKRKKTSSKKIEKMERNKQAGARDGRGSKSSTQGFYI